MSWLRKLEIETRHGDLFETEAEAIVVNTNINARLGGYALGRQLLEKSGPAIRQEVDKALRGTPGRQLRLGQAITVDAAGLDGVEKVILVAWWGRHNEFTRNFVYKAVISALRQAFEHELRSLAFPLIGTGSRQMRLPDLAGAITDVLQDLDELRNADTFSLRRLEFVSDCEHDIAFLSEHLGRHL